MKKHSKSVLLFIAFAVGYITADVINSMGVEVVPAIHADVAGMNRYELRRDRDFKHAVEDIVEDCSIRGGYVSDDHIYGSEIRC